jgi:glycerol dehydrogenase
METKRGGGFVKIIVAPNRYIQGAGVIRDIGKHISYLGSKAFIIGSKTALSVMKKSVSESLTENSMESCFGEFYGECSRSKATELSKKATDFGAEVIVGAGGGRAIDTAKAVSHEINSKLVIVPTVASTDAPCSAVLLQYTEDHRFDRVLMLKRNPDVVLVDSKIIVEAPTRFFVAGMGDALATWFEAYTCTKSSAKNLPGGLTTNAALTLAKLCFDTLMDYGLAAKLAVDQNTVTPAVEMVIEANILLSGLGFESSGVATAHGIQEGLNVMEETRSCLHGELVGFSTIAQLVMENYPTNEIEKVINFSNSVGLPVTLEQIGIKEPSPSYLLKAGENVGSIIENSFFEVTPELVVNALIGADALGVAHRQSLERKYH